MSVQVKGGELMDMNDRTPLYYQLMKDLISKMDSGEIAPGTLMPSEAELRNDYHVSRATVRKAYEELSNMGRIKKKQGIGAFASYPPIEKGVSKLSGFTEDIRSRGGTPSSITKTQTLIKAGKLIADKLNLQVGDLVNCIERIRLDCNIPIATEIVYIPNSLCNNLLEVDLTKNSIYDLFESKYNLEISTAIQSLEPMLPTQEDIEQLMLDEGELILFTERVTYLTNQVPVELTFTKYRSSKFKFWVTLRR